MKRANLYSYSDGSKFIEKPVEEIFNEIEKNNIWLDDESVSEIGSSLLQTKKIISELPTVILKYKIKSIFDIPCGDFNWFNRIDLSGISYLGGDIVSSLISRNNKKYKFPDISFVHFDLLKDPVPSVDLVFCRDCFVHFSFDDIFRALSAIKHSGSRYLMTTTFPEEDSNTDISTGGWRPLNFSEPPFNFPEPVFLLNEDCTEIEGVFKDKSLGLWKLKNLFT